MAEQQDLKVNNKFKLTFKSFIVYNNMSLKQPQPEKFNIKILWSHEPTRKYITNQIIEADLKVFKLTSHHLYLSYEMQPFQQMQNQTKFIIAVPKGYPISPPQVHSANSFITPSIRSYRDYLKPIMKENWHQSFNLKTVKDNIRLFLKQLGQNKAQRSYFSNLGQYQKKVYYDYSLLKQLSQHGPFVAFQTFEQQVKFFIVSVTSTHFLLFKPVNQPFFDNNKLIVPKEHEISTMTLNFVAQIQSLTALLHNRKVKNQFTFQFRGRGIIQKDLYHSCRKTLKISKSCEMICSLLKQMKHSKIIVDSIDFKAQKNSEQEDLLSEVRLLQQKVCHFFNKPTVRALHESYEKLVQYYSSFGLPYQEIYLKKMMNLQCREDVNTLMAKESPQKKIK